MTNRDAAGMPDEIWLDESGQAHYVSIKGVDLSAIGTRYIRASGDDLKAVRDAMGAVKNECAFSAYARAGDATQTQEMIIESCWAGRLDKALAIIDRLMGGKVE